MRGPPCKFKPGQRGRRDITGFRARVTPEHGETGTGPLVSLDVNENKTHAL